MVSVADAVQALNTTVSGLLQPPARPELAPDILINPVKSHATGIGGYIGLDQTTQGEIFACSLKAQVVIRIKADTLIALSDTESIVTNTLIGVNPTQLLSQGIYRITRDTRFSQIYNGAEDGLDAAVGKDIHFNIDFEYQEPPDISSGQISSVPLDLTLHSTDNQVSQLYSEDFDTSPHESFDVFDDAPVNNGPSVWDFNDTDGRIEQTSGISGGSNAFNASKRGSYLVLKPSIVSALPENWLLEAEISADSGGIGLIFNFRDIDNYYFFIMNMPNAYRFLGKKTTGSFSFLDSGGQDNGNAYIAGSHSLRLIQQNGEFELNMDHTPVLTARENTQPSAGSVGFLCRNCDNARFHSMRWLAL